MAGDTWTTREQLYLASCVLNIGENNWLSVSKAMRNMDNNNRTPEFFSQKNCAQQYSSLMERFASPRRKRTDPSVQSISSEPPQATSQVIEKLRQERKEELKHIIQQEQVQFRKLRKEMDDVRSGRLDHQLPIILQQKLMERSAAAASRTARVTDPEENVTSASLPFETITSTDIIDQPPTTSISEPAKDVVESSESITGIPSGISLSPIANLSTVSSPRTPSNPPVSIDATSPPKTPHFPTEFVSPSKTPTLAIVRPSTPLMSPSMSPSRLALAVQSGLLSPAKSISKSPPRVIENEALQLALQKLRSPSPVSKPLDSGIIDTALIQDKDSPPAPVQSISEPSEQQPAQEVGKQDNEKESKSPVKALPPLAPPLEKTIDTVESAPDVFVTQVEATGPKKEIQQPEDESSIIGSEAEDYSSKQQRGKRQQPKRIIATRGRAVEETAPTPIGGRRKADSGGSTSTESNTRLAVGTPARASNTSTLAVPSLYPDMETYKQWKKMILNVWNVAAGHRHASLFLQPVRDSIAPGYSKMVKRPIDLSLIKRNIENGISTTTEEVRRDLLLMFVNAVMYNATGTEVNQMAREMAIDVLKHLDDLLLPINAMYSGGGAEITKTLRSNRQRQMATPTAAEQAGKNQVPKRLRINSEEDAEKPIPKRQK